MRNLQTCYLILMKLLILNVLIMYKTLLFITCVLLREYTNYMGDYRFPLHRRLKIDNN